MKGQSFSTAFVSFLVLTNFTFSTASNPETFVLFEGDFYNPTTLKTVSPLTFFVRPKVPTLLNTKCKLLRFINYKNPFINGFVTKRKFKINISNDKTDKKEYVQEIIYKTTPAYIINLQETNFNEKFSNFKLICKKVNKLVTEKYNRRNKINNGIGKSKIFNRSVINYEGNMKIKDNSSNEETKTIKFGESKKVLNGYRFFSYLDTNYNKNDSIKLIFYVDNKYLKNKANFSKPVQYAKKSFKILNKLSGSKLTKQRIFVKEKNMASRARQIINDNKKEKFPYKRRYKRNFENKKYSTKYNIQCSLPYEQVNEEEERFDIGKIIKNSDAIFTGKVIELTDDKTVNVLVKRMLKGTTGKIVTVKDAAVEETCYQLFGRYNSSRDLRLHRTAIFLTRIGNSSSIFYLTVPPIILTLRNLDILRAAVKGKFIFM